MMFSIGFSTALMIGDEFNRWEIAVNWETIVAGSMAVVAAYLTLRQMRMDSAYAQERYDRQQQKFHSERSACLDAAVMHVATAADFIENQIGRIFENNEDTDSARNALLTRVKTTADLTLRALQAPHTTEAAGYLRSVGKVALHEASTTLSEIIVNAQMEAEMITPEIFTIRKQAIHRSFGYVDNHCKRLLRELNRASDTEQ